MDNPFGPDSSPSGNTLVEKLDALDAFGPSDKKTTGVMAEDAFGPSQAPEGSSAPSADQLDPFGSTVDSSPQPEQSEPAPVDVTQERLSKMELLTPEQIRERKDQMDLVQPPGAPQHPMNTLIERYPEQGKQIMSWADKGLSDRAIIGMVHAEREKLAEKASKTAGEQALETATIIPRAAGRTINESMAGMARGLGSLMAHFGWETASEVFKRFEENQQSGADYAWGKRVEAEIDDEMALKAAQINAEHKKAGDVGGPEHLADLQAMVTSSEYRQHPMARVLQEAGVGLGYLTEFTALQRLGVPNAVSIGLLFGVPAAMDAYDKSLEHGNSKSKSVLLAALSSAVTILSMRAGRLVPGLNKYVGPEGTSLLSRMVNDYGNAAAMMVAMDFGNQAVANLGWDEGVNLTRNLSNDFMAALGFGLSNVAHGSTRQARIERFRQEAKRQGMTPEQVNAYIGEVQKGGKIVPGSMDVLGSKEGILRPSESDKALSGRIKANALVEKSLSDLGERTAKINEAEAKVAEEAAKQKAHDDLKAKVVTLNDKDQAGIDQAAVDYAVQNGLVDAASPLEEQIAAAKKNIGVKPDQPITKDDLAKELEVNDEVAAIREREKSALVKSASEDILNESSRIVAETRRAEGIDLPLDDAERAKITDSILKSEKYKDSGITAKDIAAYEKKASEPAKVDETAAGMRQRRIDAIREKEKKNAEQKASFAAEVETVRKSVSSVVDTSKPLSPKDRSVVRRIINAHTDNPKNRSDLMDEIAPTVKVAAAKKTAESEAAAIAAERAAEQKKRDDRRHEVEKEAALRYGLSKVKARAKLEAKASKVGMTPEELAAIPKEHKERVEYVADKIVESAGDIKSIADIHRILGGVKDSNKASAIEVRNDLVSRGILVERKDAKPGQREYIWTGKRTEAQEKRLAPKVGDIVTRRASRDNRYVIESIDKDTGEITVTRVRSKVGEDGKIDVVRNEDGTPADFVDRSGSTETFKTGKIDGTTEFVPKYYEDYVDKLTPAEQAEVWGDVPYKSRVREGAVSKPLDAESRPVFDRLLSALGIERRGDFRIATVRRKIPQKMSHDGTWSDPQVVYKEDQSARLLAKSLVGAGATERKAKLISAIKELDPGADIDRKNEGGVRVTLRNDAKRSDVLAYLDHENLMTRAAANRMDLDLFREKIGEIIDGHLYEYKGQDVSYGSGDTERRGALYQVAYAEAVTKAAKIKSMSDAEFADLLNEIRRDAGKLMAERSKLGLDVSRADKLATVGLSGSMDHLTMKSAREPLDAAIDLLESADSQGNWAPGAVEKGSLSLAVSPTGEPSDTFSAKARGAARFFFASSKVALREFIDKNKTSGKISKEIIKLVEATRKSRKVVRDVEAKIREYRRLFDELRSIKAEILERRSGPLFRVAEAQRNLGNEAVLVINGILAKEGAVKSAHDTLQLILKTARGADASPLLQEFASNAVDRMDRAMNEMKSAVEAKIELAPGDILSGEKPEVVEAVEKLEKRLKAIVKEFGRVPDMRDANAAMRKYTKDRQQSYTAYPEIRKALLADLKERRDVLVQAEALANSKEGRGRTPSEIADAIAGLRHPTPYPDLGRAPKAPPKGSPARAFLEHKKVIAEHEAKKKANADAEKKRSSMVRSIKESVLAGMTRRAEAPSQYSSGVDQAGADASLREKARQLREEAEAAKNAVASEPKPSDTIQAAEAEKISEDATAVALKLKAEDLAFDPSKQEGAKGPTPATLQDAEAIVNAIPDIIESGPPKAVLDTVVVDRPAEVDLARSLKTIDESSDSQAAKESDRKFEINLRVIRGLMSSGVAKDAVESAIKSYHAVTRGLSSNDLLKFISGKDVRWFLGLDVSRTGEDSASSLLVKTGRGRFAPRSSLSRSDESSRATVETATLGRRGSSDAIEPVRGGFPEVNVPPDRRLERPEDFNRPDRVQPAREPEPVPVGTTRQRPIDYIKQLEASVYPGVGERIYAKPGETVEQRRATVKRWRDAMEKAGGVWKNVPEDIRAEISDSMRRAGRDVETVDRGIPDLDAARYIRDRRISVRGAEPERTAEVAKWNDALDKAGGDFSKIPADMQKTVLDEMSKAEPQKRFQSTKEVSDRVKADPKSFFSDLAKRVGGAFTEAKAGDLIGTLRIGNVVVNIRHGDLSQEGARGMIYRDGRNYDIVVDRNTGDITTPPHELGHLVFDTLSTLEKAQLGKHLKLDMSTLEGQEDFVRRFETQESRDQLAKDIRAASPVAQKAFVRMINKIVDFVNAITGRSYARFGETRDMDKLANSLRDFTVLSDLASGARSVEQYGVDARLSSEPRPQSSSYPTYADFRTKASDKEKDAFDKRYRDSGFKGAKAAYWAKNEKPAEVVPDEAIRSTIKTIAEANPSDRKNTVTKRFMRTMAKLQQFNVHSTASMIGGSLKEETRRRLDDSRFKASDVDMTVKKQMEETGWLNRAKAFEAKGDVTTTAGGVIPGGIKMKPMNFAKLVISALDLPTAREIVRLGFKVEEGRGFFGGKKLGQDLVETKATGKSEADITKATRELHEWAKAEYSRNPELKALVDSMKVSTDYLFTVLNELSKRLGKGELKKVDYYTMRRRLSDPPTEGTARAVFSRILSSFDSLERRGSHDSPLIIDDAVDSFATSSRMAARVAGYAENMRYLRHLVGDRTDLFDESNRRPGDARPTGTVARAIDDNVAEGTAARFVKQLAQVEGTFDANDLRWIRRMTRLQDVGRLAGPGTPIKQFGSLIMPVIQYGSKPMKALTEKIDEEVINEMLATRYGNPTRIRLMEGHAFDEFAETSSAGRELGSRFARTMNEALRYVRKADAYTIKKYMQIAREYVSQNNPGLSRAELNERSMLEADRIINAYQPTGWAEYRTELHNGGTLGFLANRYRTAPNAVNNTIFQSMMDLDRNPMDKEARNMFLRSVGTALIAQAVLFASTDEALRLLRDLSHGAFGGKEKRKQIAKDRAKEPDLTTRSIESIAYNILSQAPIENLIDPIVRQTVGTALGRSDSQMRMNEIRAAQGIDPFAGVRMSATDAIASTGKILSLYSKDRLSHEEKRQLRRAQAKLVESVIGFTEFGTPLPAYNRLFGFTEALKGNK